MHTHKETEVILFRFVTLTDLFRKYISFEIEYKKIPKI